MSAIQALPGVGGAVLAHGRMLGLAGAFVIYQCILRWRYRPRSVAIVPGAWQWLLGFNLPMGLELIRQAVRKMHLEWSVGMHEAHGKTFAAKPPASPWWVMTRCPKNIEHILSTNFDNYPKGSFNCDRLRELLGRGIFVADGAEWFHQRKTASKMFTARLFKDHIWVQVQKNARKMVRILEASPAQQPVDMFNVLNRFTLDTIGQIGFGKCIGSLDDPTSPFLHSFDRAQQISFGRFIYPGWRLWRLLRCGPEKESVEHFGRLDAYSRDAVRELRAALAASSPSAKGADLGAPGADEIAGVADAEAQRSFLGLFLADARKRGEELGEDFLRDLVLNFLIAGRDTTAQALSWAIFCLARDPAAAERARREVAEVCGANEPTYEDINRLRYVQAVISEALRLYPSVPLDMKVAEGDDVWPDGTQVRKGNVIWYNIYALGRDAKVWGDDAREFRPERWLGMAAAPDSYVFPVFNAGPRECLGKRLAQVEMKACLAWLLPRFDFRLAVPEKDITTDGQLTIGMGIGLPCYVEPRAAPAAGPPPP
mmetsp:Transcript_60960/g.186059  ORF Transcript_60960/g.186059 Transcript_60960/m.186059 type:complete len:540 (-) Transcript_60960:13-1632(-)